MASHQKEFLRILRGIDRSKRTTEVFRDFCEMAFCAIAKTTAPTKERAETLEGEYMRAVARYRNPDDVRQMPALLGLAAMALQEGGCDFLGEVAGEIGALDSGLGQFFTPYDISRLSASVIMSDAKNLMQKKKFLTLQEPAAGAGGMLIAAADNLAEMGLDVSRRLWIDATELNGPTYQMCFVQASLRGLAGTIRHGNSLTLEVFDHAHTPAAMLFLSENGHPFAQKTTDKPQARPPIVAAIPTKQPEQLALF